MTYTLRLLIYDSMCIGNKQWIDSHESSNVYMYMHVLSCGTVALNGLAIVKLWFALTCI